MQMGLIFVGFSRFEAVFASLAALNIQSYKINCFCRYYFNVRMEYHILVVTNYVDSYLCGLF